MAKERRRTERERTLGGPVPLGGSCGRGKVSAREEVPSLAGTESFRALEARAAAGAVSAKQRQTFQQGQCQLARPS